MAQVPRVFISYSHDSGDHRRWVAQLATYLMENGVEVTLDQWDVSYGDDLPSFMENGLRSSDRVLIICTDEYVRKADAGEGGVGYEKTILTADLYNREDRRKFVPIIRDVEGAQKMPAFMGQAYYADFSKERDEEAEKKALVESLHGVSPEKPKLGENPFAKPTPVIPEEIHERERLRRFFTKTIDFFAERFSQAFPGVRGVQWFNSQEQIAKRLAILLDEPLEMENGECPIWWWRFGNMYISQFKQLEDGTYLMNGKTELNISRIAAVNSQSYYRHFVYIETEPSDPTGLYEEDQDDKEAMIAKWGYADEAYGLVDDCRKVTYDEAMDGAAVIDGDPIDIRERVELRKRYITPYNFLIAPKGSPINNSHFDFELPQHLNPLLVGDGDFDALVEAVWNLSPRHK